MSGERQVIPVTEVEYDKGQSVLEAAAERGFDCVRVAYDETSLTAVVREHNARAVIIGVDPYVGPLYDALPKGGVIARFGVGCDGVDLALAAKKGILVTNTPGALDDAVAELAVWLMGAIARQIMTAHEDMRAKRWQARVGVELKGKTLAVIGCGHIGLRVAHIASAGIGMKVIGYDVVDIPKQRLDSFGVARLEKDLAAALGEADFVSLHLPSIPATRHFMNAEKLAMMKRTAFLVNTARGPIVDEAALYEALAGRRIAGAALDVFETEPYVPVAPDKDLRTLDNVVLTSHMASASQEACANMANGCLANIAAAFEGRLDDCAIVNPDVRKTLGR